MVNERIRSATVRVISDDGEQVGVYATAEALGLAKEKGLDLVLLNPTASPPVCKILNYGKYRYQQSKKLQESKKKQKQVVVKEIKLRPMTSDHDIGYKKKRAETFLKEGNKIKVSVMFRGREMNYQQVGLEVLNKFHVGLEITYIFEKKPTLEGRQAVMILAPSTK